MRYLSLLFTGVLLTTVNATYNPNLPVGTELDRLILRIATRYGYNLPCRMFMQPYSYRDIEPFFRLADSLAETQSLSAEELQLLMRAKRRYGHEKAIFSYSGRNGKDLHLKVNADLLGVIRPVLDDSVTAGISGIASPSIAGNIGSLSFYSRVKVWTEYRSDTLFPQCGYQPWEGISYNLYGRSTDSSSTRSSDIPVGGLRYDTGPIQIETAVDYLRSGPAVFFPLTLSGNAPPVTFLRATLDLDVINYTHVIGGLKVQKDKRKYIYMHRLSAGIWKHRLLFGINEVIINGNFTDAEPHGDSDNVEQPYVQNDRGLEWVYCIPFLPFKFVEHYAGDRDNAAISFDIALRYPLQWYWYGEFFLDDMLAPWKLFSNDWGNKWGFTAGAYWFGTMFGRDLTVQAEYSRVEPWVYTHFSGGSHRYTHFNAGLGSPLGPNSQGAVLAALLRINRLHEAGIGINHFAWNNQVRGGEITDVFQHPDPQDSLRFHDATVKHFLGKGTQWFLQPVIYWNFNVFGRFTLQTRVSVDLIDRKGRVALSASGGLYF